MKRFLGLLIFINSAIQVVAQGNLVLNPSFESISGCPTGGNQVSVINDWINPTNGTPDYFNVCYPFPNGWGVPNNVAGEQVAHSGGAYPGLVVYYGTYMEYIQTRLNEPLQAGETYCVGFYVSLAGKSDFASIGPQIYFSDTAISSTTTLRFPYSPQIMDTTTIIYDTTSWTLISGEYIAHGGESYLTIGNFREEADTPHDSINNTTSGASYFFIDDVSVFKKLEADAGNDHIFCVGDSLQLGEVNPDSGIVFSWSPITGLSDSVSPNPWAKPTITTTYTLSIIDTSGQYCTGNLVDSVTITINNCPSAQEFYIPTILKGNELLYIPALPENSGLDLYDQRGRLVYSADNYLNDFCAFDISAGVYFYRLKLVEGDAQTGKICIIE